MKALREEISVFESEQYCFIWEKKLVNFFLSSSREDKSAGMVVWQIGGLGPMADKLATLLIMP
ncbi:MAG: hypothetical protein CM1200mP12_12290 [Gammaproteobacteria bacterium]|nr:MAG: hypothetical protein CM1200mP12_12290 [Gammaproteobacteria bacterium]